MFKKDKEKKKIIKSKDFYILLLARLITNFGDSVYAIASTLLV